MNTVAGQISLFTDASVELRGPLEPGPSLYQWVRALLAPGGDADCGDAAYREATLAEARELGPDSYPTRAFYGQYLTWAYRRIVAGAPATVIVTTHPARAVALADDAAPDDAHGGADSGTDGSTRPRPAAGPGARQPTAGANQPAA